MLNTFKILSQEVSLFRKYADDMLLLRALDNEDEDKILLVDALSQVPSSVHFGFKVTVNKIWSKFSKFRFFFLLFSQRKHSSLIC